MFRSPPSIRRMLYGTSPRNIAVRNVVRNVRTRLSRSIRRNPFNSLSRQVLASRVHVFKRMGAPIIFRSGNSTAGFLPTITAGGASSTTAGLSLGSVGVGATAGSYCFGGSLCFSLAMISNSSEITNLFDNYRIKKVSLKFILSSDNAQIPIPSTAASSYLPIMHYTYDIDDAAVPTDQSQVLQNSFARTVRLGNILTMDVAPRANAAVTANPSSIAATGGILSSNQWLDTSAPNVFHYGVKFWMDQFPGEGTAGSVTVQIIPTFYIEAKNVV